MCPDKVKMTSKRESLIYIAFLYLRHHKGDFGGYEKKKYFSRGVAGGARGVNRLEWLVYNDSRRFWGPPREKKCWRATILEGLKSTIRHGGNILLIYIHILDCSF